MVVNKEFGPIFVSKVKSVGHKCQSFSRLFSDLFQYWNRICSVEELFVNSVGSALNHMDQVYTQDYSLLL